MPGHEISEPTQDPITTERGAFVHKVIESVECQEPIPHAYVIFDCSWPAWKQQFPQLFLCCRERTKADRDTKLFQIQKDLKEAVSCNVLLL